MLFKKNIKVPVEVSARHCHLSKEDLETLFGAGHELKVLKQLGQPSDFACEETVDIKTHSGVLQNVRVVGPLRTKTQVEVSRTDAILLGVNPPVRLSGQLQNSSPVALCGLAGCLELNEGLIIAKRHIHCAPGEAVKFGLKNGGMVKVEVIGERPVVFEGVVVRVRDDYRLCMHIDTDEGNAAGINKIGEGILIK